MNEIEINGKMELVFPHQLKVVATSDLKVEVLNSYYRGSYYLIEAQSPTGILFFESQQPYNKSEVIYLEQNDTSNSQDNK